MSQLDAISARGKTPTLWFWGTHRSHSANSLNMPQLPSEPNGGEPTTGSFCDANYLFAVNYLQGFPPNAAQCNILIYIHYKHLVGWTCMIVHLYKRGFLLCWKFEINSNVTSKKIVKALCSCALLHQWLQSSVPAQNLCHTHTPQVFTAVSRSWFCIAAHLGPRGGNQSWGPTSTRVY